MEANPHEMILDLVLPRDAKKRIDFKKVSESSYKPSQQVKDRTAQIMSEFTLARELHSKPYREFNDKSLIERQSADQASFNSYVPPQSNDPDDEWKSNAIRPIVRNRVISIAAHVTGTLIYPQVYAQNDRDESDKDAASVMRDLMEYSCEQSNYQRSFLLTVLAACVNPAACLYTEYATLMRTVKEEKEDGSWTEKKQLDDVLSGFQDVMVPLDELFLADIYQPEIQKQPFVIWRRAIDYTVALQKYGGNALFTKHVRPGIQCVFDRDTDTFYDQYDETLQNRLVEEVIYWNRTSDLRLVFVNGVLMTHHDQPNPRKDKKYPFIWGGYEFLDEGKFAYFMSLVRKMASDEEIVNTLYRMIIDGTYLAMMPPVAVFGDEDINSSVITPGRVSSFGPNTKLQPIGLNHNFNAGFNAINKVESSISESSNDQMQAGMGESGDQTAFEVSRLEQNAKIMLGLFAKMIADMVKQYGELRMGDILQHLTVGEMAELGSGDSDLRYKSFLLPDKTSNGKKKSRQITLEPGLPMEMPEETMQQDTLELSTRIAEMEDEGDEKELIFVNPAIFRNLKFKVSVRPEAITPPSDNLKKALNLELYDRAIMSPVANQEALYKKVLLGSYEETRNDVDEFVMEQQPQMPGMPPAPPGQDPGTMGKLFGTGQQQNLNKAVA